MRVRGTGAVDGRGGRGTVAEGARPPGVGEGLCPGHLDSQLQGNAPLDRATGCMSCPQLWPVICKWRLLAGEVPAGTNRALPCAEGRRCQHVSSLALAGLG